MGTWQRFAADRVIVIAAPNGARRTRADHPALPMTAAQLAADAVRLQEAGASVLHLHVRDEGGGHTLDTGRYRDAIAAIRECVGDSLILQVTTEAVGRYTADEQLGVVRNLEPEAVSLALREICPAAADRSRAALFFAWMRERSVWPQIILYTPGDVARFEALRQQGVFADDSPFVLFVLGRYASATPGRVQDLQAMLGAAAADEFPWAVCCFGPNEQAVMGAACRQGGHVRIGFENNLLLADGSRAPDNAALLSQFVAGLDAAGRRPATAAEIRQTLARRA